jgi:FkbM family methyltransferase
VLGGRPPAFVARQALEPSNYRSLARLIRVCPQPLAFARRYFLGGGAYPARIPIRTPLGLIAPTVHTHHDVFTINEVFYREDYALDREARVVVDVGANIGISALYFLTRSSAVRAHLYEPDPRNAARLRENLDRFASRWVLHEEAVADSEGIVGFGRERTGRYGGVGLLGEEQIDVQCRHINAVLRDVLAAEGRIDMLKIDTEGLENRTVSAIDRELLAAIPVVVFESSEPQNPWPERFAMRYATQTCRLTNAQPISHTRR